MSFSQYESIETQILSLCATNKSCNINFAKTLEALLYDGVYLMLDKYGFVKKYITIVFAKDDMNIDKYYKIKHTVIEGLGGIQISNNTLFLQKVYDNKSLNLAITNTFIDTREKSLEQYMFENNYCIAYSDKKYIICKKYIRHVNTLILEELMQKLYHPDRINEWMMEEDGRNIDMYMNW